VTDAYVVSGILNPDNFLGGTLKLDPDRAFAAVERIGATLGLPVKETAEAILRVATSNMYAEFVPALAHHGVDPAEFALFPYGGAGPTHAFMLADEVNLRRVIVPPSPGTLCALGCLVADLRADFVRTIFMESSHLSQSILDEAFSAVQAEARAWLEAQGIAVEEIHYQRTIDMRYKGQSFEIAVDLPPRASSVEDLVAAFSDRYREIYGYADPDADTEIINIRGAITGRMRRPELARIAPADGLVSTTGDRPVRYDGAELQVPIYDRAMLGAGAMLTGPAIVEQYDTTTFITPGWSVEVDSYGNLIAEADVHARR
jgi:N-methylhydantoinase A